MIQLRQIPPISLGSESDQVLFAALTDGPKLAVFPVMRAHADVVSAAAVASAKGVVINKQALPDQSVVALLDAHAMVYTMKPMGFLVDFKDNGMVAPNMIVGGDRSGEFIPVSPSLMAVVSAVWHLPIVAPRADFEAVAVPVPAADVAVEWSRKALSGVYAEMIATRFQGIEFDTTVPEALAVRLGLFAAGGTE